MRLIRLVCSSLRAGAARRCLALAMVILVLSVVGFAQTTANLAGTITDSSGAAVPKVKVTLTNTETGVERQVLTNDAGLYEFTALQPGEYKVDAAKEGFAQETRSGIRLELNQVARMDFSLRIGAVSENVQVTAAAPMLESSTSQVGQVIETKSVSDLPLNGRNFAQLAILGTALLALDLALRARLAVAHVRTIRVRAPS